MEIKFNRGQLEECCEFVENFCFDGICLWSKEDGYIGNSNSLLYAAFLQEVIEGINRRYAIGKSNYYIIQGLNDIAVWNRVTDEEFCSSQQVMFQDYKKTPVVEAKEIVITFVLGLMEVHNENKSK